MTNHQIELVVLLQSLNMQNSQFYGSLTGARFRFHISVTAKANIRAEIADQWNYLPSDTPSENILAQIREDFEDYLIPALLEVHNIDEWKLL